MVVGVTSLLQTSGFDQAQGFRVSALGPWGISKAWHCFPSAFPFMGLKV